MVGDVVFNVSGGVFTGSMTTPINDDIPDGTQPGPGVCVDGVDLSVLDADLSALDGLSGDELLTLISEVARVLRRAEAVLVAGSTEVAARSDRARGETGLAARHGFSRPSLLLEQVTGLSARSAGRFLRLGALTGQRVSETGLALPPLFPAVREALDAGLIGIDAAEVITKALHDAAPRADVDDLVAAEGALVGQATGAAVPGGIAVPADLIAVQARIWKDALDPNGIEPRAESAFQRRDFWVSRKAEGDLVAFGGRVTVDVAAKLHAVFDAVLTPRTAPQCVPDSPDTTDTNDAHDAPKGHTHDTHDACDGRDVQDGSDDSQGLAGAGRGRPKDPRTPGQQRADVFAAMIDAIARSGELPTISGAAPTVLVTVPAEVLERKNGTGQVVGVADPVPYSAVDQILCDGGAQPVFLDPGGGLAALTTRQRTFTRAQKLAIIARDGPTCFECDIPATGCEVHHVTPWSEGGRTEVGNGVILCWFDHRKMHAGDWKIVMVDGKPVSIPPDWMTRKPYFH